MRILLVEDNIDFAGDVVRTLSHRGDCDVVWARSRDAAKDRLGDYSFDLLILDRSIPTADDVLDDDVAHGWAIFLEVRERYPGLPVWFLTATEDPDFASEIANEYARQGDIHGQCVNQAVVRVIWKKNLHDVIAGARRFVEQVRLLEAIPVNIVDGLNLSAYEEKNLRLFSRRHMAASVEISSLGGGLSGARVLRVEARNAAGQTRITSVAKIGRSLAVEDEVRRYNAYVVRLLADGFPQLSALVDVGSGEVCGVYYGLVPGEVHSAFASLTSNPGNAASIPAELRRIQSPWESELRRENVTVGEIRRRLLPDPKLQQINHELQGIDIAGVERVRVDANRCSQHNDLHGENALIYGDRKVMVIDFNDVGDSFAGLDPVTLSLSTIFHKNASSFRKDWPDEAKMGRWCDVDAYTEGCDFSEFIKGCRSWANAVSGSPKTTSALAYAYAIRQLKYADTDKKLARALIRATVSHLLDEA